MNPYWSGEGVTLHHGDCIKVMSEMPAESIDSICTDPPYGLGFMGKAWDDLPPGLEWAQECLRVLKPGGHILAFGGTRTWHRLAVSIEDAGFEIRDSLAWMHGQGFPKSHDVSKGIDKLDAASSRSNRNLRFTNWMRQHLTASEINAATDTNMGGHYTTIASQPAVPTSDLFQLLLPLLGARGVAVPAWVHELIVDRAVESENFKRREVTGRNVNGAGNGSVVGLGSAALMSKEFDLTAAHTPEATRWEGWGTALKPAFEPIVMGRKPLDGKTVAANVVAHGTGAISIGATRVNGRWPANVILDTDMAAVLDQQSGEASYNPAKVMGQSSGGTVYGNGAGIPAGANVFGYGDKGGASRFFYVARKDSECPNPNNANTAQENSFQPNAHDGSARSDAATLAHPDTLSPTHSTSTNEKASASRPSEPSGTTTTALTVPESSPGQQLVKPSQMVSRARYAATLLPTDTTTTTPSRSTFDGSADLATFSTTSQSKDHGAADYDGPRFKYTAKASGKERPKIDGIAHPTVKPLALMRWLIRLVTPTGGIILDPFAGSGTTIEAAMLEGFQVIGIEREAEYLPLIQARIDRNTYEQPDDRYGLNPGLFDVHEDTA